MNKKSILTWLQATSEQIHIGNYFGAIAPLIELQNQNIYDIWMFVANLHSITKILNIKENHPYNVWTYNLIKTYIACGVDVSKSTLYIQSDVPWHTQLEWILSCYTHIWFMERMHSYKDAKAKNQVNTMSIWSMDYPILMAADILLYDIDVVPVGKDQQQHVEYCVDIAQKFNHRYGDVFKIPTRQISQEVWEVPGIDGRKMSKSYNNYIGMMDSPEALRKKCNKIATTDLLPEDPKDPDSDNTYNMLKLFLTEPEKTERRNKYINWWLHYKTAKDELYERLISFLWPIQNTFSQIDDIYIRDILTKGAEVANAKSNSKIDQVYKAIWFR